MKKSDIMKALGNSKYLPKVSPDILRLLDLLNPRGEASLREAISLIEGVHGIEYDLLTFVNSGFFGLARTVESAREAVLSIGMRAVRIFIVTRIAKMLLPEDSGRSLAFKRSAYQNHILGTSVAAEIIGEKLNMGERYTLFAYGLLHDIGVAAIDLCLPDQLDEIMELELHKKAHQIAAEKRVLDGLTHADLGAWLCDLWHFPEDIREVVACHHAPQSAVIIAKEVKILHMGDLISTNYYEHLLGLNFTKLYPLRTLASVGISLGEVEQIGASLHERVEGVKALLK